MGILLIRNFTLRQGIAVLGIWIFWRANHKSNSQFDLTHFSIHNNTEIGQIKMHFLQANQKKNLSRLLKRLEDRKRHNLT